jgi:enoyl-CoA hydratase
MGASWMGGWNENRPRITRRLTDKFLGEMDSGRSVRSVAKFSEIEDCAGATLLRLISEDGTNRLTRECVLALTSTIRDLAQTPRPLVITGNEHFFSAGADLNEIAALDGPAAYEFSKMGQELMNSVEAFPATVCAAIRGYCMGGGLDLALACHMRIAHPHATFGHRGAALGLITAWGGTQRLPRLIGKSRALKMLVAAEKLTATQAWEIGLVTKVVADPVAEALQLLRGHNAQRPEVIA